MRKVILACLFVSTVVVAAPGPAHACSCAGVSDQRATQRSRIVFSGTLTESRGPLVSFGDKTLTYLFEVDTVVKGDVPSRVLMTNFIQPGNSCSSELTPGRRYLVFGDDIEHLEHQACSPTHSLTEDAVITGSEPLPGGPHLPPDPRMLVLAAILMIAVASVAIWMRSHKHIDPAGTDRTPARNE